MDHTPAAEADAAAPALADLRITVKQQRAKRRGVRRLVQPIVRQDEELNRRCALHDETAVFDNAAFPWVAEVEAEWRLIRAELDRLLARQDELPAFHEVVGDATTVSRDRHWKSFFLLGYGVRFRRSIAQCPETWRILQ